MSALEERMAQDLAGALWDPAGLAETVEVHGRAVRACLNAQQTPDTDMPGGFVWVADLLVKRAEVEVPKVKDWIRVNGEQWLVVGVDSLGLLARISLRRSDS